MKIKKVEIQAFRAYDHVDNGTFDFKLNEEEYADFISLYAPNGFGKTSFYDAIEYGYTKNIDRLLKNKNNKDIAKSEKNISNDEKQYILRNRYSSSDLESFIKLETDKKDIVRSISHPRRGASDFKFDEKETENKYFREVILSQDWISGFLKEDKPEDRYKTFINFFGDKELDKYYNSLTALLSQNEKEIKRINSLLKGVQLDLKFDGDKDVLSKINTKIELLNEKIILFKEIDSQTSESDILELTNSITERLSDIEFEVAKHQSIISDLDVLILGNETLLSFKKFRENCDNLKRNLEKQNELSSVLTKVEDLKTLRNQLNSIQDHNLKLEKEKEEKRNILNLFPRYLEISNHLKNKDDEIERFQLSNDTLNKKIAEQKIQVSELEVHISANRSEIDTITQTVKKLPEIEKNIRSSEGVVKQLNTNLGLKKDEVESKSREKDLLDGILNELNGALFNIENEILPSEFDKNFVKYSETLQAHEALRKRLEEENKNLSSVEKEITEHDNFQLELDQFISKGLSIINDTKTDDCPLCNTQHKSYKELADKVINNSLLSEASNILLNRKNEINDRINAISEDIGKTIELLKNSIKGDVSKNELKIQELNTQVLDIKNAIIELETKIENESKKIADIRGSILNKSLEEYNEWAEKHLTKLNDEINQHQLNLMSLKAEIKENEEEFQLTDKKKELLSKDIESHKSDKVISEVKSYFLNNYSDVEINSKHLEDDLKTLSNTQKENQIKLENTKTDIDKKELDLVGINEDSLKQELEQLSTTFDKLSRGIDAYKIEAKKSIDADIQTMDNSAFDKIISDTKKINATKILDYQNEVKELDLLFQLKENVLPYLKFEENKKVQSGLKTSKSVKDKINKKLKQEIDNVSNHIAKQIKSFFYEDLINDLYKRIDPHPDYKKVKFIPDFKDNKPKLNVCVFKDEDSDKFIIPNLYFSQAQLNILSLCIFLAKALNAKDDKGNSIDCIFVDDPIQSMDSINILSTIDLLRSIIVNQQKQIILSTHDENFHNLLKKKIPSDLFKSKFMELETFGKVKN